MKHLAVLWDLFNKAMDKSEDRELNLEAKSSTGSTPRKSASRRNSSHEPIDEYLEDDSGPGYRQRTMNIGTSKRERMAACS